MTTQPDVIDIEPENTALTVVSTAAPVAKYEPRDVTAVEMDPYFGVAARPFAPTAQEVLAKYATVPDEWIDIKPNGQIYLSHMRLRAILNEAFGFGGWGLVPAGDFKVERKDARNGEHVTVYREYRFYGEGRFVRQTMGAGDYYTSNAESNYSDAVEASESYALNRVGKFLGIAAQCWDRDYADNWKSRFAALGQDRNGKDQWKKKRASSSPKPAATSSPAATPHASPAERSDSPSEPSSSSGDVATVVLDSIVRAGKAKSGADYTKFADTGGGEWMVFGAKNIEVATTAMGLRAKVRVEFKQNGKWRNVERITDAS